MGNWNTAVRWVAKRLRKLIKDPLSRDWLSLRAEEELRAEGRWNPTPWRKQYAGEIAVTIAAALSVGQLFNLPDPLEASPVTIRDLLTVNIGLITVIFGLFIFIGTAPKEGEPFKATILLKRSYIVYIAIGEVLFIALLPFAANLFIGIMLTFVSVVFLLRAVGVIRRIQFEKHHYNQEQTAFVEGIFDQFLFSTSIIYKMGELVSQQFTSRLEYYNNERHDSKDNIERFALGGEKDPNLI
ncbi:MAG: hypothetical protein GF419_14420, partial [Ignavibacteriales bacterium]|nr:hypothetical protein [Ignavibacteriales bacterium]